MAWRVVVGKAVQGDVNGLYRSGVLSRTAWLRAYAALRSRLPEEAHRFRERRYPTDPVYFCYPVRSYDKGVWHSFTFSVNDSDAAGLLVVEDVDYEGRSI